MLMLSRHKYKKITMFISLLVSLAGSFGIYGELCFLTESEKSMASLTAVLVAALLYKLYSQEFYRQRTLGNVLFCLVLAIIFSVMICIGAKLDSHVNVNRLYFIGIAMGMIIVFYLPIVWITDRIDAELIKESFNHDHLVIPINFLIISACWFCCFLALYPGVYAIDAPTWYLEFSDPGRQVTSQWSPIIAGFFYLCVRMGEVIFKSSEAGMALYSVAQMLFSLFAIWNVLIFLNKYVSAKWCVIATMFYAMIPTHAILAVSAAQDAWFSASFALVIIKLLEYCMRPKEFFNEFKNSLQLYLSLICLCICRNNGLYAIVFMAVVMIFTCRNYRMWVVITASVVTILVYQGPVMKTFHVDTSSNIREMLSIPLQQMGYAYRDDTNSLNENDRHSMEEFVDAKYLEEGLTEISDTVKSGFKIDKFKENPRKFLEVYIEIGRKTPKDYLYGLLYHTIGLWYPEKHYADPQIWHPYINVQSYDITQFEYWKTSADIRQHSYFPLYLKWIQYLFGWDDNMTGYGGNLDMHFSNIPILSVFCKMGIYFWMIIYMFFYALFRRKKFALLPLGLVTGLSVTILLSPVMYYRYYAPVIFSSPLWIQSAIVNNDIE